MKLIDISTPTYPNTFAIIDDEDYEWLNQWKWCVNPSKCGLRPVRSVYKPGNRQGTTIYMSRYIMDAPENMQVDHKNHNTLDNRRCNLRICTQTQNNWNLRKKTGRSKYKGVYWDNSRKRKKRWAASIKVGERVIRLGRFLTDYEAAKAYDKAALKYFGEFACLNFKANKKNTN